MLTPEKLQDYREILAQRERVQKAMRSVAAAEQAFGLRLLRAVAERSPNQNVFLSPISIFLALAMAESGSAGATRTALRDALGLPDTGLVPLHTAIQSLFRAILDEQNDSQLLIANALWSNRDVPLAPDFVKLCESVFRARAASLDFAHPDSAAQINRWVHDQTMGRIGPVVTPDTLKEAGAILTNAVYFAGRWKDEFSKELTADAPFHLSSGGVKSVPMMQAKQWNTYRNGRNFEGVEVDYRNSRVCFYALLPNAGTKPADVLESLDVEGLGLGPRDYDVVLDFKLPRLNLDFSASLGEILSQMGMDIAFRFPDADFEPMGSRLFYLSEVIHKTRLEVDEEGTVAAAATVAMLMVGAARPRQTLQKKLIFDRPFVVAIVDWASRTLLFAGIVEEP